ncbi:MAG TPA: hypothetical protein VIP09_01770 [Dehalococcoidia bacterium]|jgi:hypothetical protein
MSTPDANPARGSNVSRYFLREEHQYAPFIGSAIFSALFVGFPLGLLLAHEAAQGSGLGGRFPQLVQVHGHTQLFGWLGLFVMGMGYRLVPRFTAVKLRHQWWVPLTLACAVVGLALRAIGQTFADEGTVFAVLFGSSGALEFLGVSLFVAVIIRALLLGRPDEFGYKPFFAAGVVWLAVAMLLNAYLAFVAAGESNPILPSDRSDVVAFLLLYGFAAMFVLAVSIRTFPTFFGRERANRTLVTIAWAGLNAGIALYATSDWWGSYEQPDGLRYTENAGFLLVGAGLILMVATLGIFKGSPHRLRESARRNMRFVRSAYAWLALAAVLQVCFAASALADSRFVADFQTDAVRHFIAIGFLTTVIIGMAFLVMPALAMRRLGGRSANLIATVLLTFLHGAAASRGLGSLIVNEGHINEGYWTMTVGGTLAVLAMAIFAGYMLWSPKEPPADEITLTERV